jgi:iron(III) transport system permease protein
MSRRIFTYLALALIVLFFGAFFFFPIVQVLRGGFVDREGKFTLIYFLEVFRNRLYLEGLWNSLRLAVCATGASLLLAVPLAWLADRFDFRGKRWLAGGLLLPMILPPFVGALGMEAIFGQMGAANLLLAKLGFSGGVNWLGGGFWGVVAMESLHLYPILYLNAVAAFANVDPQLLEAAADSGCVGFRRFRKIMLPLIMPGIFAGSTIVFIWSFTELGTPLMFHYGRVTAVQVFDGLGEIDGNAMPYALVTVMMAASALLYVVARLTFGRKAYAMTSKAGVAVSARRLRGLPALAVGAAFALVVGISVLPHLGVIGMAVSRAWYGTVLPTGLTGEHFEAALGHNLTVPSILNSVRYAGFAVLLSMVMGVFVALIVVRGRGRGRWLVDMLAMLPLAVPGLVLAFGYVAMTREGRLFHFLDPIQNPTILLIVAYAVRRLPYVVRACVAGLQQTSETYEEAAASLGAGPVRRFRRITMPLISANLIAGGILAFSFSMLEVSDSLILAQKTRFFPITKAIYELSMLLGDGPTLSAALGVWTMVFLGTSLLAASWLLGKRLGALFRV